MPLHILARRLPLLLTAAVPFLAFGLIIGTYVLPASVASSVVALSGTWKLQEGAAEEGADPAVDDSGWKELHLPGGYTTQGFHADQAWARKRFELPEALRGQPLLFLLGGVRGGQITVFMNGHEVGRTDDHIRGLKGEVEGLEAWTVDPRDVRPGANVIALRFEWTRIGGNGVKDARLLLGAREQLLPYYLRESDARRFIQNGALALFVFMLVLLGALMRQEREPHRRALQRATLWMVASAALYLGLRMGVLLPLTQSGPVTFTLRVLAVVGVTWAMAEFAQQYCLERVIQAGKVHRIICGMFAGSILGLYALDGGSLAASFYRLFALYIFVTIGVMVRLTAGVLWRRRRVADLVFSSAILCLIIAAVVDLLTDLNLLHAPRLTSVAIVNMGMCAGALLIADFFQLSHVNETLSGHLKRTNAELEVALARAEDVARLKGALLADRLDSVGTLATGMAHEINNPMAYVTANLTYLSKHLSQLAGSMGSGDPLHGELAELEQVAAESLEGARRVNLVVKELKLFARGSGEDQVDSVDMCVVARRSLNLALHVLENRARIVQDLGEVPRVLGSESQLGLACLNLLLNAGQAMKEADVAHNELVLRTRQREDGWVILEVSDTGRGISAEDQRRLFDPFFTTKPTGEGMGMGLSIVHGIVSRLRGEIQVESRVGKGSLFRIVLPPAPRTEKEQPPAPR